MCAVQVGRGGGEAAAHAVRGSATMPAVDHIFRRDRRVGSRTFEQARADPQLDRVDAAGPDGWAGLARASGGDRRDEQDRCDRRSAAATGAVRQGIDTEPPDVRGTGGDPGHPHPEMAEASIGGAAEGAGSVVCGILWSRFEGPVH